MMTTGFISFLAEIYTTCLLLLLDLFTLSDIGYRTG